ncbi:hypothetical protein IWW36_000455 [Coemansia brasiliensis]|uniref:EamA domain-containing protein n=1 Tax=Coemansia brasiliensis TaxID=2650707 RepID=A0A9W8M2L2_9FUNG|nr:hypothetical protein IWW36_000455 [Coemansia brasiliensis]
MQNQTEASLLLPHSNRSITSDDDAAKKRRDELKGYVFMALSALGFASNSACVKALAISHIPSLEIVFARSIVQLSLGLLGCMFYRISPLGPTQWQVRKWLLLRGAAGAFGNACFFYAVSVMPLADATVVFFTGPVFSALFANWMLGEPYDAFDRAASVLCMSAIVMVVKPTVLFGGHAEEGQLRGAVSALVGAMSGALAYCVVRRVGRAVHSMVHVVYFGFLSMVGSSIAMFAWQEPRMPASSREWILMGMLGTFAFGGQVLLNRGLQLAPAGPGTLMRNLDVVFAFVFGISLFDEVPDWISVGGALAKCGLLRWILVRGGILYLLSILLFTCPHAPNHPVCQISSAAKSKIVAPLHDLALSTETGARINTAYRAHLVPFYEKHGAPVVNGAHAFISESAAPALKQATKPMCDSFHRAIDPYTERVSSLYVAHAKPTVDAVKSGICTATSRAVVPIVSVVGQHSLHVLREYVGPTVRVCVYDYMVPFYANHIHPRWNNQIRPAVCHYFKVAVQHTRTSVLPAVFDGAAHGARLSREFAFKHIVPHVRRATMHTYAFAKTKVYPPIYNAYAQTLKPHVDRIVPWDRIDPVLDNVCIYSSSLWNICKVFAEEVYFMCYTIVTGAEHPLVLEKQRKLEPLAERRDSGVLDAFKLPSQIDSDVRGVARKISGSARQWVQVARGWMGSAAGSAKSNIVSYGSRAAESAKNMWSTASSLESTVVSKASDVAESATAAVTTALQMTPSEWIEATSEAQRAMNTITSEAAAETSVVAEKAELILSVFSKVTERASAPITELIVSDEPFTVTFAHDSDVQETVFDKGNVMESAQEPIEQAIKSATEAAIKDAEKAKDAVTEAAHSFVERGTERAKPVVEQITEKVVTVAEPIQSRVTEAAASAAGSLSSKAADKAATLKSKVTEAAVNIGASIKDEVTEQAASMADTVVSAGNAATEAAVKSAASLESTATTPDILKSAAEVTSAIESKLEEIIEDGPSIPVPSMDIPLVSQNATLEAEEAASVMYKARDAMAGVFVGDEERAKFGELVKNASEGVENLENFPSVLDDMSSDVGAKLTKISEKIAKPVVSKATEKASEARSVVERAVASSSDSEVVESAIESSSKESSVDSASDKHTSEDVSDTIAPEPQSPSDSVDEDVRKSASNWVKDARKSISKELAEERTRTIVIADTTTTLTESAEASETKEAEAVPEEPAAQVLMDKTNPVSVSASQKPEQAKKRNAGKAEPSKSVSLEKPQASKSDKAVPAANVPAPETTTVPKPPAPSSSKGPRKVKKTKKRVIKKTT